MTEYTTTWLARYGSGEEESIGPWMLRCMLGQCQSKTSKEVQRKICNGSPRIYNQLRA